MRSAGAVLAGALLLAWPAMINGYALVFSDTAGLADMGLAPDMGWDKPWVYGPLILLMHWGVTLWGVVAGQCLLLSAVLWAAGRVAGPGRAWSHLALCGFLALGSAAPWFASFVMPDIFAPLLVLCFYILAFGAPGRLGTAGWIVLAAVAIGVHLAHLIIAAALIPIVAMLRWRRLPHCAAPLLLALAWVFATNLVGNGKPGISPYGSVFALARLQADGPAADYLKAVCPAAGYRTCAWVSQLPMDSDRFLWSPDGPVWDNAYGPILYAPEASRIVRAALAFEPLLAARQALLNTAQQLVRVRLGDTLGPQYLRSTVGLLLRTYFPRAETARFEASRQVAGSLPAVAAPLAGLRITLLAAGALATLAALFGRRRRGLVALVLAGLLANAFATGALSGPHDRYGARIAWLVLLPPSFDALNAIARRRVVAAGGGKDVRQANRRPG